MKNLTTLFLITFFSLALAATGQAENIVTVETHSTTSCTAPCHPIGWLTFTFDSGTTLSGGPEEYQGDFWSFDLARGELLSCKEMDYQISGENTTPILVPGLSGGTYGPVTLSGGTLIGTGSGISFRIMSGEHDPRIVIYVIGDVGSSITVPDGETLTITLFDSQTHDGYMWKKNGAWEYSESIGADDNTLEVDSSQFHDEQIVAFFYSKENFLVFTGDNLLATILRAIASPGPAQVVFDGVTLDGSQSQGSDGSIVQYQWQLEHWENQAYNRAVEGASPTISGLEPGFYHVTLTVTDDDGCTGTGYMLLAAAGPCNGSKARVPYLLLLHD